MAYNDQMRDIINIEVVGDDAELPNTSNFQRMFGIDIDRDVQRIQRNIRRIPSRTGQRIAQRSQMYQKRGIWSVDAICTGNLYRSIAIRAGIRSNSASFEVGTTKDDKGYYFAFNGRNEITLTDGRVMKFRRKCRGKWVHRRHVGPADPRDWMEISRDNLSVEFPQMINEAIDNVFQ